MKRACTTPRPEIPEGTRKEAELIFHHQIVNMVEKYSIPSSLIINIDQTPLKYAPVTSRTMSRKNSKHVHIAGFSYKQAITGTFGITLSEKFLSMQLIYGGKTAQTFPKFKFPATFSLSANPKHFSNTAELLKLLEEIIIPYVKDEREKLELEKTQPALLILHVFSGQMTTPVTDMLDENNIKYVCVPANMTNLFQPLDLTVNRSAKAFMTRKFAEWHSLQITKQLDSSKNCNEIEVKLLLSILKRLHASWIIELYNHFTSSGGREIIANGWEAAGITNATKKGAPSLDLLNPFSSIDPLEQPTGDSIFSQQTIAAELVQANYESDDEDEWVVEDSQIEDRNIFEIFDDEM